jgi:glycine oxidase
MSSRKEVVIIGGGVVGSAIAFDLAKRGVPSIIVERDSVAARASGKSWAVWSYPKHTAYPVEASSDSLLSGSRQRWEEIFQVGYHRLPHIALELQEKGGVDIGYNEVPRIRVAFTESEEEETKARLSFLRNEGYFEEGAWLEAEDLRAIYPDINPQARGGMLATTRQVEPYQYTLGLAQAAEKMGAEVLLREVVGFSHKGTRVTSVIFSSGSELEADVFVIAMGPWTGQGTTWLGKEIPIWINREQCLRIEVPERLPYGLSYNGLVILPKANGSVIIGHAGVADHQPNFDASLTEEVKTALLNDAITLLPRVGEARVTEHRGDLEGWAPPPNRTQPVLGRLPEWDNAYVAARMGTLGMMMSLGVGRFMAELITREGQPPNHVKNMMDYLSPARL